MSRYAHLTLATLAEIVGTPAALKLAACWGGLTLYVPDQASPDHAITRTVGLDAFVELVRVYGGQSLWIPTASFVSDARQARVCYLLELGVAVSRIAWLLGLTPERVKQIAGQRQPSTTTP